MTSTIERVERNSQKEIRPLRRAPRRDAWTVGAWIVAIIVAAPLAFLGIEAFQAGWASLSGVLFRGITATLMANTIEMTVLVTAAAAFLGVGAAWILERTDVPARRALTVLLIVPAAIPDFIETFGWVNALPWLRGLFGAVVVLSLAVYPFVMLPAAAALRRIDHRHEEVARNLGASRISVVFRVTVPEIRGAIAGGCLLVALQLLAEYGSFQMLGFRTFTTEIYSAFQVGFDTQSACALSIVLVIMSALLVGGEATVARREGSLVTSEVTTPARMALGRWRWPALGILALLVTAALCVPVGSILSLLIDPGPATLPGGSLFGAVGYSLIYALAAAALATAGALTVALGSRRSRSWLTRTPVRVALIPLAVPGLVGALALSYVAARYAGGRWYQTSALLVVAYAVMFLPLALIGIRASLVQVPESLTEVAASLGSSRISQLVRVILPLILPGLAAGFALVFLSTMTELAATLVLVPTGVQTLATQFWTYQTNIAYGQAAPYALAMIVLAGPPLLLLTKMGESGGGSNR
ncbi:MAG: iron ABC transporter permease [Actinomycetes bacterium]